MKYAEKNKLLGLGIIAFAVIIYFFSVRKTIVLINENAELKNKTMSTGDLNNGITDYRNKLTGFQANFGLLDNSNKQLSHEVILGQLSSFCSDYHLLLRDFPSLIVNEETGYEIETSTIIVEGGYQNIVQLLFFLEKEHKIGRIASVKFQLEMDRKTQLNKLSAKIYVQNIKQIKNEI